MGRNKNFDKYLANFDKRLDAYAEARAREEAIIAKRNAKLRTKKVAPKVDTTPLDMGELQKRLRF